MTNFKEQKNTPNGWKNIYLKDMFDIKRGGSPRPIEKYLTEKEDGLNWLMIGDIKKGAKFITKTSKKIIKEGLKKTTLVKKGDFILSNSMSFGRPYILGIDTCIHDGWLTFQNIKNNILDRNYLYYLLLSPRTQAEFLSVSAGSGVQNLKKETVSEINLLIPPILEQNKIVQILETWDEYLEEISKKIEIKKNIKRGLMQKLLKGQIRLKGFIEKWKKVKLGDVIDFKNGKAHEKDIAENGKYIVINSKFISSNARVYKCSNKNLSPLSKGEITMVMSDVPKGKAIAKCFLVDEDNKYTLNQRICSLSPKNSDSKFLYYILNRNKYFIQFDDGVKQTNLRKDDILDCYLEIPSIEEQRVIASILTKADLEIKTLENKKKNIEDQKRYLLNNLITGKIRIPEFEKAK